MKSAKVKKSILATTLLNKNKALLIKILISQRIKFWRLFRQTKSIKMTIKVKTHSKSILQINRHKLNICKNLMTTILESLILHKPHLLITGSLLRIISNKMSKATLVHTLSKNNFFFSKRLKIVLHNSS